MNSLNSIETFFLVAAIFALGIITFFYRYSFISPQGKQIAEKIPVKLLSLLAPATFSAIIANHFLAHQSNPHELQLKVIVAVLSILVAYFTKNAVATLAFGLTLLHFLQTL